MRIAIIGYSGAGKSTLARTLGERYGIPVLFLDTVQFTANWAERDRGEARAMVEAFMARPDWVIDGNRHRTTLFRSTCGDGNPAQVEQFLREIQHSQ